jgi:hypothetical protein
MTDHSYDRYQLAASLPASSRNGQALSDAFIRQLWNDLKHPPISYVEICQITRYQQTPKHDANFSALDILAKNSSIELQMAPTM